VTFAPTLAITTNILLSLERWIPNDVSLFELSIQERSISFGDTPAVIKPVGAAGVDFGVGVGVGVTVGLGLGVGVTVAVGVGVGVALGVTVGEGVGVGVGLGDAAGKVSCSK
jgi:hypothetical protein